MNVLLQDFPEAIAVGEQILDIDYDYRNCIRIITAWEDEYLTNEEKIYITLDLLYNIENDEIEDKELAFEKACLFLNSGEQNEATNDKPKKRVYSFEKDNKYVYSAIDGVLDGRLSDNKPVHWWLFGMAFMEIPESCMLSKIIYLRTQKNKGKLTAEEKKMYKENIEIFEIDPNPETVLTEVECETLGGFMDALKGGAK